MSCNGPPSFRTPSASSVCSQAKLRCVPWATQVLCELAAGQGWEAKVSTPVLCSSLLCAAFEPRVCRWLWGRLAEALKWGGAVSSPIHPMDCLLETGSQVFPSVYRGSVKPLPSSFKLEVLSWSLLDPVGHVGWGRGMLLSCGWKWAQAPSGTCPLRQPHRLGMSRSAFSPFQILPGHFLSVLKSSQQNPALRV